jgi:hypothetical protein
VRNVRTASLAGAAAVALAGLSGAAAARDFNAHLMTVQLPDGSVAEIRYTGDVPPQVMFNPAPAAWDAFVPVGSFFGPGSPFAMLDRIAAEMDREAASLMRRAEMLANAPAFGTTRPIEAALGNLPPGTQSYTVVSTWSGNGVCTQAVEITSPANGGQPRVVSRSSGNCGSSPGSTGVIGTPGTPAPVRGPDILETRAPAAQPYAGVVREAAWQR